MKIWEKYAYQLARCLAENGYADDFLLESGSLLDDQELSSTGCKNCPALNEDNFCILNQEFLNREIDE